MKILHLEFFKQQLSLWKADKGFKRILKHLLWDLLFSINRKKYRFVKNNS